jgi:phosphoglucosamine mutase
MSSAPRPGRLFGTDGIRAPFGAYPLDRPTVTALAIELGVELAAEPGGRPAAGGATAAGDRPLLVVGGDTRDSTPEICRWLGAGLAQGGAAARYVGVIPTPGVAWLVRRLGADGGIAVSASHNPHPDNGVKLIDRRGFKWSEAAESALEGRVARRLAAAGAAADAAGADPAPRPSIESVHSPTHPADAYLEGLAATLPAVDGGRPLAGLRVALDPGNGAASAFAGPLFARLGAATTILCAEPDGRNINRGCGSTDPGRLAARVAGEGCHLGIAFDGDADRAILVDEGGRVHDGDAILYLWATALAAAGGLAPPRIAVTSMSNFGLDRALARRGIAVVRCGVGDREVVETMRREGLVLGGEPSGHVVHLGLGTTGDGLLTALHLAALVRRSGRPLSELVAPLARFPQVLVNVRVAAKPPLEELPGVAAAARAVEAALGDEGRLVLRYSGTEPLARVMIEGPDQARVEALAGGLAAAIRAEIGVEEA